MNEPNTRADILDVGALIRSGMKWARTPNALPRASHDFRKAALIDPGAPAPLSLISQVLSLRSSSSKIQSDAMRFNGYARACDPTDTNLWIQKGHIHSNMSRKDLALASFETAVEMKPDEFTASAKALEMALELGRDTVARNHLDRCRRLRPDDELVQKAEAALGHGPGERARPRIDRFPDTVEDIADLKSAMSRFLLHKLEFPRILTRESRIFAAGSCFAINLATALNRLGYTAFSNGFGESINSTLANRAYVEWIFADDPSGSEISKLLSENLREETRQTVLSTDIFVFTVGVAPVFLDRATGDLRLQTNEGSDIRRLLRECDFRTLSVEENVENLCQIIAKIREHRPEAAIFLTLSPVPLNATFEYPSAVMADCVSKSVLRVSIDQIERMNLPNVYYWPAFEAVRWLGAYQGNTFGEDDGSTRHVSLHTIDAIIGAFVDRIRKQD